MTTTGAATNLNDAILALSPAGYWKLTETSGTTINDLSGRPQYLVDGWQAMPELV